MASMWDLCEINEILQMLFFVYLFVLVKKRFYENEFLFKKLNKYVTSQTRTVYILMILVENIFISKYFFFKNEQLQKRLFALEIFSVKYVYYRNVGFILKLIIVTQLF